MKIPVPYYSTYEEKYLEKMSTDGSKIQLYTDVKWNLHREQRDPGTVLNYKWGVQERVDCLGEGLRVHKNYF